MATESFLRLKGRTTYFRRKIPADLMSRLASSEICFRLGVIDRDSAVRLARRLVVEVDAFFVSARRNAMLSSHDLSRLLGAALEDWRSAVQPTPVPLVKPRHQAKSLAQMAGELLKRQSEGFGVVDPDFVAEMCARAGVQTPTDETALEFAGHALTAGMASHYLETAATLARLHDLDRGLFPLPVDQWTERSARLLARYGITEPANSSAPSQPHGQKMGAPAISKGRPPTPSVQPNPSRSKFDREAGETFSSQAPYIVGERVKVRQVGPDAVLNLGPSLRLWLQICGDRHIREYTPGDMAEFRSMLIDIPKIYWRSKAEQAKHILQIIAAAGANGPDYVRVSPKTVNKHISNLNSVFENAKAMGVIDRALPNFADGLYLETGSEVSGLEEHEERPGYTRDQVKLFFTHPVYTGRKSDYFYNSPGTVIIRDALYWLPLLAAFQLMRREEICQLKVKHIKQEGGIWYFDLAHHEIKLKRPSSKRRVPLHDSIIELGFLKEVVEGRDQDERLFPELEPNGRGSFSDAVGKRVSRMIDSLDIKLVRIDDTEADGALHPFRHHGITQLENRRVPGGITDALSGHSSKERRGERRRYTDEIYLTVLRETINMLDIPVDVSILNRKWEEFGPTE